MARTPSLQPLNEDPDVRRKMVAILRVLSGYDEPLGARALGRELEQLGIVLSERQVRYHLQFMDERGLTLAVGNAGRVLTDLGRDELASARWCTRRSASSPRASTAWPTPPASTWRPARAT